jgi:hypothetical protein
MIMYIKDGKLPFEISSSSLISLSSLFNSLLLDNSHFVTMVKIAALVALAAPLVAAAPKPQEVPNIVGGTSASAGEFPFIVSITNNGGPWCGGTLINANTVLTASHCVQGRSASAFAIRAGSLVC